MDEAAHTGDGVRWDVQRRWRVDSNDDQIDERTTAELAEHRVVIQLGPAGAGKTYELRRLAMEERSQGRDSRVLRLVEYSDSAQSLRDSLNDLLTDSSPETVLFLDALDEAMVLYPLAWVTVKRWVTAALPGTGVSLRITCRSALWKDGLKSTLVETFGENSVAIARLQPLSADDIRSAASSAGIDAEYFLLEVDRQRAGSLAEHPLSLSMLLRVFAERGGFPDRICDLFQEGTRILATDQHDRFETNTADPIPVSELLADAERLACYLILGGADAVSLADQGRGPAIHWSKLERLAGGGANLSRNRLAGLGACGLFDAVAPKTLTFGHRQFAEYLAARRLSRMLPHQARSLLAPAAGWRRGVAGPLRETAAFAAMMNDRIAAWLSTTDPEVIGLSDVADAALRQRATKTLLDRFRSGELTDAQVARGDLSLIGLQYPDAAADLRPVIEGHRSEPIDALEFVLRLIEVWHLSDMSHDLARLVLDGSAAFQARETAGWVLQRVGSPESWRELKPLIKSTEDPNLEFRGRALLCNWPQELSTQEILSGIDTSPRSEVYGSFNHFLRKLDESGFCAEDDLALGLQWAGRHYPNSNFTDHVHSISKRMARRALRCLDDPTIADGLAALLERCSEQHARSPLREARFLGAAARGQNNDIDPLFGAEASYRHDLLDLLVRRESSDDTLRSLAFSTPGLLHERDFQRLLAKGCDDTLPTRVRLRYLQLSDLMPWIHSRENVEAWMAVRDRAVVRDVLNLPLVVELDSEPARRQRERWEEIKELHDPPEPEEIEPSPAERIEICLDRSESVDPEWFYTLVKSMMLDLEQGSRLPAILTTRNLEVTPGWASADEPTRERILDAAERFLEAETDLPEGTRSEPSNNSEFVGAAALFLVQERDPSWFDRRPAAWWQLWAWYIMRESTRSFPDEPDVAANALLERLRQAAPSVVRNELLGIISRAGPDDEWVVRALLQRFETEPDPRLDSETAQMLADERVSIECLRSLMRFVCRRTEATGLGHCLEYFRGALGREDRRAAVDAFVVLMLERPGIVWGEFTSLASKEPNTAKAMVEAFALERDRRDRDDGMSSSFELHSSAALGDLVHLLFDLYPPDTDPVRPDFEFHQVTGDDEARRLRSGLIDRLSGRADADAADALLRLESRFGERYPWLRRPRSRAERAHRMSEWEPIPLPVLASLFSAHGARLIRSGNDLLDSIEAAVEEYGEALRTEGPDSPEDLWDSISGRRVPKAEEHVSGKICGAIRAYLKDYGIAANREVQIHRRQISRPLGGEPGSELDVLVQLPTYGRASNQSIRIPIEVKRSCHADVKQAMRSQLADRYMAQLGVLHGVYIVVWMNVPDPGILAGTHRPRWQHKRDAKEELDRQATAIKEELGYNIRTIILDASLE